MRPSFWFVLVGLALTGIAVGAGESAVPFAPVTVTVIEPEGRARASWPLSFGFPLPRGALTEPAALSIVHPARGGLPVQARVLARWSDGSIRWVLLDTHVTLAAREQLALRVQPGKSQPPERVVRVTEGNDGVEVDTGAARFAVRKRAGTIVEGLAVGGTAAFGPVVTVMDVGGTRFTAQPPRSLRVTERGPLRARIELEGSYGNGFDYVVRLDAFAGHAAIRAYHTLINRSRASYTDIAALSIEILLASPVNRYGLGLDEQPPETGSLEGGEVRATQVDNVTRVLRGASTSGRLAGWATAETAAATVGVAARWLWQEYPQGFVIGRERLTYHLWDPAAGLAAKAGSGAAKTHELVLTAEPKGRPADGIALARPLVGAVAPEWVARTGALPQAIAPGPQTQGFIDLVAAAFARYRERNDREMWNDTGSPTCRRDGEGTRHRTEPKDRAAPRGRAAVPPTPGPGDRQRAGAYGMWNWGDWNFPGFRDDTKGCDPWGNLEYDTAQVLALAHAATGDPEIHAYMVAAARHFMDVDRIHFDRLNPEWVGMNHPKNPLHFSFELGGVDLGHTWSEGLVSYYYLTGDERGLAAARGIADYLVNRLRTRAVRGNPRQWGWPQIALWAVFEATGEDRYRNAALQYARGGMAAHAPNARDWKVGILADALAYTHAVTVDKEAEAWLKAYVKAVTARAPRDARFYPAVAYVGRLTGDTTLQALARERAAALDLGAWGKPFTIGGRTGFRIHSLLAAEKR